MLQTSEIARLIIALVVLPFIMATGRQLRTSGGGVYYLACVLAVYVSYVATVVEEYWIEDVANAVQHLSLGAAGILALLAALYTRRERAAETDDM